MEQPGISIDNLLLVGLNHKFARVELREKLAFRPDVLQTALKEIQAISLAGLEGEAELVLLSTCNRTEIYTYSAEPGRIRSEILGYLGEHAQLSAQELERSCYSYAGEVAAHHLLQVSAGLDSLVLGEHEILGQVKGAFEAALESKTCGTYLSALFRAGLQTGKRVQSETEIGGASLSIASVVVELTQEMFGSLSDRTALLIGAGKISALTARALTKAGLHCILVANRTFERATELAADLGGQAIHFEQMPASLIEADIVICSTGAPHIVLHEETVRRAMSFRTNRPLLVADLAVPRDADPLIAELEGVHLKSIDDLDDLIQARHPLTADVRRQAEDIVIEELECFRSWFKSRLNAALICALQNRATSIVESQLKKTVRRLGNITPEQQQAIEKMGKAIASRILHEPIQRLKSPAEEDSELVEVTIRELFGLNS
jgi:glutamyl-tRNA reductase